MVDNGAMAGGAVLLRRAYARVAFYLVHTLTTIADASFSVQLRSRDGCHPWQEERGHPSSST